MTRPWTATSPPRRDDHPGHAPGTSSPLASPSRHPTAALWGLGLSLWFIFYETMLPFDFRISASQLADGLERATFFLFRGPDGEVSGNADIVGNIFLFVPFGICLALSPLLRRAAGWRPVLLVAAGLATSLTVELVQLFSPKRWAQTTDLVNNTLGTLVGVILALTFGRRLFDRACDWILDRLRREPTVLVVLGLTLAAIMGALLPLDLSIRRDSLALHLQTANWQLLHPFPAGRLAPWLGLVKEAWLFAFWGAATAQILAGRRWPLLQVLGWGALLAVFSEACQLFVVSRSLSLIDPVVAWCGSGLGAAVLLWGRRLGLSGRNLAVCFGTGYVIYLIADTISPLAPTVIRSLLQGQLPDPEPLRFRLIPFQAAEHLPTVTVLGEWSARLVRFVPLGAALQFGLQPGFRRWATAGLAGLGILLLQLVVGRISPWPGDMTEVLLAWAGIAVGWYAGRYLARFRGQTSAVRITATTTARATATAKTTPTPWQPAKPEKESRS